MPAGTTIYFYSENGKALLDSFGGELESMSAMFDQASPSQTVGPGEPCPNYTLYPPDDLDIKDSPDDVDQYTVGGPITLAELVTDPAIIGNECYWAACRVVDLNEVGGELIG